MGTQVHVPVGVRSKLALHVVHYAAAVVQAKHPAESVGVHSHTPLLRLKSVAH